MYFFGGKIQILWNSNIVGFCQNLPVLASRNDLPLWMSFMPDNSRSAALWIWPFLIGPLWFDDFFWKIGPAFRPPVASPVEDGMVGLMLVLRSWNYRACFIIVVCPPLWSWEELIQQEDVNLTQHYLVNCSWSYFCLFSWVFLLCQIWIVKYYVNCSVK